MNVPGAVGRVFELAPANTALVLLCKGGGGHGVLIVRQRVVTAVLPRQGCGREGTGWEQTAQGLNLEPAWACKVLKH